MQLKRLGVAAMTAAALGAATDAQAATSVSATPTSLTVNAANARANNITVFYSGTYVRVSDLGDTVNAGGQCMAVDPHTADCPSTITRGRVVARDMDDRVLTFTAIDMLLYGDDGTDILRGGTGDDRIRGGTGADAMFGDTGEDWATYSGSPAGVTVTLENAANDGVLNEGDNVSPTIENVLGSSFDDRIVGSASPNVIQGVGGNDRLWGLDGADTFPATVLDGTDDYNGGTGIDHVSYAVRPARVIVQVDGAANDGDPAAAEGDNVHLDVEQVTGGSGDDALLGNSFDNRFDGALGNDFLDGRGGADTLIGGIGIDRLFGGFGNDTLEGVDGTASNDMLDGQGDIDTCTSDAGDTEVACEL